jgi:hypothetical protein
VAITHDRSIYKCVYSIARAQRPVTAAPRHARRRPTGHTR